MKKFLYLIALLGACSAQALPEATDGDAVDTQALVAPGIGRGCEVIRCLPGYVCEDDCGPAKCVPIVKPECTTDADCRLFSDYCDGCNCLALGLAEADPKCSGNVVQCLIDPCLNVQAQCVHGSCVAGDAAFE